MVDRLGEDYSEETQHRIEGMCFSADASTLVVWRSGGTVTLWDRAGRCWTKTFSVGQPVRSAALSRAGRWLAASTDGQVIRWRLDDGVLVFKLGHAYKTPFEQTFVADDRFLLGVSDDRFQLWPVDLKDNLERLDIRVLNPLERMRFGLAPLPLP